MIFLRWFFWLALVGGVAAETLIERGAAWDYRTGEGDWKAGASPLGYGEEGLGTEIGGKPQVVHFRQTFEISEPVEIKRVMVLVRFDDGIRLLLNGKEAGRLNLPEGELGEGAKANYQLGGANEIRYYRVMLPPGAFVEGENVLAADVFQASATSSDLYFDLELRVFREGAELRSPVVGESARRVTDLYHQKHRVGVDERVPDGYVDGGRGMRIGADGSVGSGREVITVDRKRDEVLRKYLELAGSEEVRALEPVKRARRLAEEVDKAHSPGGDRDKALPAVSRLQAEFSGYEVLLGDLENACGGGVCRHRSLLFKMMADEAGLKTALVRGNMLFPGGYGGHAWNELHLGDGEIRIVDVMNPKEGFAFPDASEAWVAKSYVTVRNEPIYGEKVTEEP